MISLRNVQDYDIQGKTVLYRAPYDIEPLEKDGQLVIRDNSRITATLPTLKYLQDQDCKIVVVTYIGRPDGTVVPKLSTNLIAEELSKLLKQPVEHLNVWMGERVQEHINALSPKEIVVLENIRFDPRENDDDDGLAQELASFADVVVMDGFPQAHREQSSTTGIMRHLPSYAGLYFQKEVEALSHLVHDPQRPFAVVIGGAKVSDKVEAVQNLYDVADIFLLGGGVANVFLSTDKRMGNSYIEDNPVSETGEETDWVEFARALPNNSVGSMFPEVCEEFGVDLMKIQRPIDLLVGDNEKDSKNTGISAVGDGDDAVPSGWAALDIGPETRKLYASILSRCQTIFWNGPMGKFEDARFAQGSGAIARAMADSSGLTIIGGGDSIAAAKEFVDLESIKHVSLAGGATLDFLAGNTLPVIAMLED